jgi:branched-chain amino acid transport system substrate-binding protein
MSVSSKAIRTCFKSFALGTLIASSLAAAPAYAEEQYFPLQVYRQGPYAAGGTGFFGGMIDYMNLINMRDGGVNGVKLTWSECETGYEVEKGIECYQRMKDHQPPPSVWTPLSVGISYAMTDKVTADRVPLTTINHGRTESSDGRVFEYLFPLLTNSGSETSAIVQYIGSRFGGMENLKGKKIVILFHGSPYGKETTPLLRELGQKYGFEVKDIEVPHPGVEQGSQWLEIKRYKPDFVILRGWGIMNPVALKTARRTGYPIDHIVGNIWSNSEEDVKPAGEAGTGYVSVTTQISGTESPILQDIIKIVYGAGKGNLTDKSRIGSVYHNLGIVNGMLTVEAMRVAQKKFGNHMLTGDQFRWGFEHLKIDEAEVDKLGAKNLFHTINVTCEDHEGHGELIFQKWDGKKYTPVTDWIKPDWAMLRPIIEKASAAYAKEKGITPRDCAKEETQAQN